MNDQIFKQRLINILGLKKKITRNDLVKTLNVFWQHSKQNIDSIYVYYCYTILKNLLNSFDKIIEESNRKYYYVYNKVLISIVM